MAAAIAAGNNSGFNAPNAAAPGTPGNANSLYTQAPGTGRKISNHQSMFGSGAASASGVNSSSSANQFYNSGGN